MHGESSDALRGKMGTSTYPTTGYLRADNKQVEITLHGVTSLQDVLARCVGTWCILTIALYIGFVSSAAFGNMHTTLAVCSFLAGGIYSLSQEVLVSFVRWLEVVYLRFTHNGIAVNTNNSESLSLPWSDIEELNITHKKGIIYCRCLITAEARFGTDHFCIAGYALVTPRKFASLKESIANLQTADGVG